MYIVVDIFARDQKIYVANEEILRIELTLLVEEDERHGVEVEMKEDGWMKEALS
jgi:hypothetical protein